jgi:hypothetical protein
MRQKRTAAAGLAAGCLGIVAAMVASAPAGAYIPEISASPDSSTVLGAVTVYINADSGSVAYYGTERTIVEATEWAWSTASQSWDTPCSEPDVSVDIDLYPPTATLTISDPDVCPWTSVNLGVRIKGAEFTGATLTPSNDNMFVVPLEPEPLSNSSARVGRLSYAMPTSLTAPLPVPAGSWFNFNALTNTYDGWFTWAGTSPANLGGTSVISLVMAGVPAAPVGAGGVNFTG